MNAAKVFTVTMVCLGLGIPGAHGVALCFGSDGSLSLEAALNGPCVGAAASCCSGRSPLPVPGAEPPTSLRRTEHGSTCRDVVLGQHGIIVPLPSGSSAKRLIDETPSGAGQTAIAASLEDDDPSSRAGRVSPAATHLRPPPVRAAVLRL